MVKVVIISDTKIKGKHIDEGTVLELDEKVTESSNTLGELNSAGRIVVHDSDGHKLWLADKAARDTATKKAAK